VHIAPGAVVCGDTRIGDRSMIGAGAVVTEGLVVGADCRVGAGAVVTRSIEQPGVYIGCPARKVR
jgi:UDP-perosamine 4-acetyltransferase